MKKWTQKLLEAEGYKIQNAQIKNVSLNMADHGVLTSDLTLDGHGWGVCYGGYVLGKGYVGAKTLKVMLLVSKLSCELWIPLVAVSTRV